MPETLGNQEFADQLPKSTEFDRSRKMAISAAELSEHTEAQLIEAVAAKNDELEQQGLIGSAVEVETLEDFRRTSEGLMYNFYGLHGQLIHQVSGKFNGLTVLDTSESIVSNKSGFKLDLRSIRPDRFVVCAEIGIGERVHAPVFVPLRGIEVPLHPRKEFYDEIALASLRRN